MSEIDTGNLSMFVFNPASVVQQCIMLSMQTASDKERENISDV